MEYKTRLEEMLQALTKELETISIHNPENPSDWVAVPDRDETNDADENIVADGVEEWETRAAIVADLEGRYNSVTAALARIDAGTFGTCEVCGAHIEAERLGANPAARTCIEHRDEALQ